MVGLKEQIRALKGRDPDPEGLRKLADVAQDPERVEAVSRIMATLRVPPPPLDAPEQILKLTQGQQQAPAAPQRQEERQQRQLSLGSILGGK